MSKKRFFTYFDLDMGWAHSDAPRENAWVLVGTEHYANEVLSMGAIDLSGKEFFWDLPLSYRVDELQQVKDNLNAKYDIAVD